ncbi:MAG: hypothetical protein Q9181_008259 [Wetmoreana brouardii]
MVGRPPRARAKTLGPCRQAKDDIEGDREKEKELRIYDRKVHKAYGEMVKATEAELNGLGIPFFCLEQELVARAGGEEVGKKVGERELEALKRRMVEFLEDMVRE